MYDEYSPKEEEAPCLTPTTSTSSYSPLSTVTTVRRKSIPPSPSRSRLDPEYVTRIAQEITPPPRADQDVFFPANTPDCSPCSNTSFRRSLFSYSDSYSSYNDVSPKRSPGNVNKNATYSDRFIPSRTDSNLSFSNRKKHSKDEPKSKESNQQPILDFLLRSELLDDSRETMFRFSPNPKRDTTSIIRPFNLSPLKSASSHRLLANPSKRKRRISKMPFKVLDAPALQDDFYLNLVDWSAQNVLAVGLSSCVYLWSAYTSKVTKLCDLSSDDVVTSVSWSHGSHLAVGTNRGEVQIWDTLKNKKVRTMMGHSARTGTLAWNGPIVVSGSRDRSICVRDTRSPDSYTAKLASHKQEVCGLKWSYDEPYQLASGGNDNKLLIWDIKNCSQPIYKFSDHNAAVKAIAFSPHQHGLLVSGGGTADRCIRFWNTLNGTSIGCVDTGSQVCNIAWSRNCNELVSTHGYSLNQIIVWQYPSMSKVVTLTGHTYRVLYLAVSPDGSTIVTGAGDETLRFWQIFPGPRSHDKSARTGLLFPPTPGSTLR